MKKLVVFLILTLFFIIAPFFTESLIAQPPPPTPEEIPIDGGLSILLAAGLAYGARRLYLQRDDNNQ